MSSLSGETEVEVNILNVINNGQIQVNGLSPPSQVLANDIFGNLVWSENDFAKTSITNTASTPATAVACGINVVSIAGNPLFTDTTIWSINNNAGTANQVLATTVVGGTLATRWSAIADVGLSKISNPSGTDVASVECKDAGEVDIGGVLEYLNTTPFILSNGSGSAGKVVRIDAGGNFGYGDAVITGDITAGSNISIVGSTISTIMNPNFTTSVTTPILKLSGELQVGAGASWGIAGNILKVNAGATALEYASETDTTYSAGTNISIVADTIATIANPNFATSVTTPDMYMADKLFVGTGASFGTAGQLLRVNAGETALEYATIAGASSILGGTNINIVSGTGTETVNLDASINLTTVTASTNHITTANSTTINTTTMNATNALVTGEVECNILDLKVDTLGRIAQILIDGVVGNTTDKQFLSYNASGDTIFQNPWTVTKQYNNCLKNGEYMYQSTILDTLLYSAVGIDMRLFTYPEDFRPLQLMGQGNSDAPINVGGGWKSGNIGWKFQYAPGLFLTSYYCIALKPPTADLNFTQKFRWRTPMYYTGGGTGSGGDFILRFGFDTANTYKMTGNVYFNNSGTTNRVNFENSDNVNSFRFSDNASSRATFDSNYGLEIELTYFGDTTDVWVEIRPYGTDTTTGTLAEWITGGAVVVGTRMTG